MNLTPHLRRADASEAGPSAPQLATVRASVRLAWGSDGRQIGQALSTPEGTYFEPDSEWDQEAPRLRPLVPPFDGVTKLAQRPGGALLGFLGDAIPDGWGLRVLHAQARARGADPAAMTPAELLCLVGENGPGALTYHPAADPTDEPRAVDLDRLQEDADRLYTGEPVQVAEELRLAAGPSGGARPKALIDVLPDGTAYAGHPRPVVGAVSYLIKFPTQADGVEAGKVELAVAEMARLANITIPRTRPFVLQKGRLTCFGVERFDRPPGATRPHMLSLAGMHEMDFRDDLIDYTAFLKTISHVTQDHRAVLEGYRRLVFNVLVANRDDHAKNFAFLLPAKGEWCLAPAFDLTVTLDRRHTMPVAGVDLAVTRADVRAALGKTTPIKTRQLEAIEDEVRAAVDRWEECADAQEVSKKGRTHIEQAFAQIREQFFR
jgi:serine/threonine-protein kinase HipA